MNNKIPIVTSLVISISSIIYAQSPNLQFGGMYGNNLNGGYNGIPFSPSSYNYSKLENNIMNSKYITTLPKIPELNQKYVKSTNNLILNTDNYLLQLSDSIPKNKDYTDTYYLGNFKVIGITDSGYLIQKYHIDYGYGSIQNCIFQIKTLIHDGYCMGFFYTNGDLDPNVIHLSTSLTLLSNTSYGSHTLMKKFGIYTHISLNNEKINIEQFQALSPLSSTELHKIESDIIEKQQKEKQLLQEYHTEYQLKLTQILNDKINNANTLKQQKEKQLQQKLQDFTKIQATNGLPYYQFKLANIYLNTESNKELALYWLLKASQQNYQPASQLIMSISK
jgi:hypothetical protein